MPTVNSVNSKMPLVLGITGGVASGKSTVTKLLANLGASAISADEIARQLLAPGSETTRAVLSEFGSEYSVEGRNDEVDRAKLAQLIFSVTAARLRLNALMHPRIRQRMQAEIELTKSDPACQLVAVEIPLLFENRLEHLVDKIAVATCPFKIQMDRLKQRRPDLADADVENQILSQMPLEQKRDHADYVINTDQPLVQVELDVRTLFDKLARPEVE